MWCLVDVGAGGYEEWEAKRRPRNAGKTTARKDASSPPPPKQQTKPRYKDQRDYELLPRRVEELEAHIVWDEQALSDPDVYVKEPERFAALSKAVEKGRADKDADEVRWLELAAMVEKLSGSGELRRLECTGTMP